MTDEERWKIEGKTRDALRDTKKTITSLQIELEEYAENLKGASDSLRHFLKNPIGPGPTGMTSVQYLLHFFRSAIPSNIELKLLEFEKESERLRDLERKVGQFN